MNEHALWELFHELAKGHEQLPAIEYRESEKEKTVSYGALIKDMEIGAFQAAALPEGRIGFWGSSSYTWIVAAYACMFAGKHVIFFDSGISREDFLRLAAYADTEAFVVSREYCLEAREFFPDVPVYVMEDFLNAGKDGSVWEDEMLLSPPGGPEADIILFTSGTSSGAKGVVIPVETLARHLILHRCALPGNPYESYFVPVPLFHLFGFLMVAEVLNRNGIFCLSSGVRNLTADLWAYRADNVTIVPSMIRFILDTCAFPPQTKAVITGGSLCPKEYQDTLTEAGITLYGMYGMSETLGIVGVSSSKDRGIQTYRLVEGVEVTVSEEGEVFVTLPCHFKEYYRKEAETEEILKGDTVSTGDLGKLDEGEYLTILGRLGDIIVLRNGEKLNAVDLDAELSALPGVKEAAAFGFDGSAVLAFIPGEDYEESAFHAALARFNRGRSVDRKIVRVWKYPGILPVTSTGKRKRNQLSQEYRLIAAESGKAKTGRQKGGRKDG